MPGAESPHLCWDCLIGLEPVVAPFCDRCGDPVDGLVEHAYQCSFCRRRGEKGFTRARSAVRFRGPVREVMHAFKYGAQMHLAEDLTRLLATCVRVHYEGVRLDAVMGVPLFPGRQRRRTYNQAALLARRLARHLGLEHAPGDGLVRVRDTQTQTGLTAVQRGQNVHDAFAVAQPGWVRGRTLLLVDDVMTTGATVASASQALREAGAAAVYVVTVARG